MKPTHLRLVTASDPRPRKVTRPRKSILAEIERLSELYDAMRQDYREEFTDRDTQERVSERISALVREVLTIAPKSVHAALSLAETVAENSLKFDDPEVITAMKNLATFYADHAAWMERMAAKPN